MNSFARTINCLYLLPAVLLLHCPPALADNGTEISTGPEQPNTIVPSGPPEWIVNNLDQIGCDSHDTEFAVSFYNVTNNLHVHTVVDAGGNRYMNESVPHLGEGLVKNYIWRLYPWDSGGDFAPTTGTWPLPPNTPVTVNFYIRSSFDGYLMYHRRVVLSQCNGGQISSDTVEHTMDGKSDATFDVVKQFYDDNPAGVEVTLSCNTGLPIEQGKTITAAEGAVFVVKDFTDGQLNCTVTEEVPFGYSVEYAADGMSDDSEGPPENPGCRFNSVKIGDHSTCRIINEADLVPIEVTKIWHDDNPDFENRNSVRVELDCEEYEGDSMRISGNPGEGTFWLRPHYDGEVCDVNELGEQPGVLADDSDCQNLEISLGIGASCTIENTRLYEGIPSLNRGGLALLTLLLLGLGLVSFRRMA